MDFPALLTWAIEYWFLAMWGFLLGFLLIWVLACRVGDVVSDLMQRRRRVDAPKTRIAVVGAGMSGICMAIKLIEAGFKDVVIFEKSSRLGGNGNPASDSIQ